MTKAETMIARIQETDRLIAVMAEHLIFSETATTSDRWTVLSQVDGSQRIIRATLRQAVAIEEAGWVINATPTAEQIRTEREWAAQGISTR